MWVRAVLTEPNQVCLLLTMQKNLKSVAKSPPLFPTDDAAKAQC